MAARLLEGKPIMPIAAAIPHRILLALAMTPVLLITAAATAADLPKSMSWTSYDVGSAGYAEASAIADAFGKKFDVRVRIRPSGSSIGRLQPLLENKAGYGFLATEAFFAAEGIYDFADRRWGPQNLRGLAGRPSSFGIPTAKDANIRTVTGLRGKRVAYIAGNPSINVKCDALIAFGGLTRNDVEAIMFPTYNAAMKSLAEGKADATCTTTTPSQLYELAESPRGIYWVPVPPDDKEGWERLAKVAPFLAPYTENVGAGISSENPAAMFAYRYPVLVTTADTSADEVYAFVKALDETYGMYKDATAVTPRWDLKEAGRPPMDVPFHEGAIRYMQEKGIWTEADQQWNDRRLRRLEALLAAWRETIKAAEQDGIGNEQFPDFWEQRRQRALATL
ncbi:MAG TPA: TAXI family TRAP transporter solute-binding subunit [Gammaproteobacteria bacterium]|nr:TAXI family TRAP transporter solute-binding subunit [Gammaproteobacteria bacterium]